MVEKFTDHINDTDKNKVHKTIAITLNAALYCISQAVVRPEDLYLHMIGFISLQACGVVK